MTKLLKIFTNRAKYDNLSMIDYDILLYFVNILVHFAIFKNSQPLFIFFFCEKETILLMNDKRVKSPN